MALIECGLPSNVLWASMLGRMIDLATNDQYFSKIAMFIDSLKGFVEKEKKTNIKTNSCAYELSNVLLYSIKCLSQINLRENMYNFLISLENILLNRKENKIIEMIVKRIKNSKYLLILKQLLIHSYCLISKKFNVSILYDQLCEELCKRDSCCYELSNDLTVYSMPIQYDEIIKKY